VREKTEWARPQASLRSFTGAGVNDQLRKSVISQRKSVGFASHGKGGFPGQRCYGKPRLDGTTFLFVDF